MTTTNGTTNKPVQTDTERLIIALGQRLSAQNEILQSIALSLTGIDTSLRQIAQAANPAPNIQRPLSEYPSFDWSSIGATILKEDDDGVSVVEWQGQQFTRRSVNNKYEPAVWFSRAVGKDQDGNNKYVRLVTFKQPSEAEPIAAKSKKLISQ